MLNVVADVADFQTSYANTPSQESFSLAAQESDEGGSSSSFSSSNWVLDKHETAALADSLALGYIYFTPVGF